MRRSLFDLIAALLALGLAWRVLVESRRFRAAARPEARLPEEEDRDGSFRDAHL